MEKAILFGNGFNRLEKDNPSWSKLLKNIPGSNDIDVDINLLPPTFQYEYFYIKNHPDESTEFELKKGLAKELENIKRCDLYDSLLDLDVNIFVTPNYDRSFSRNLKPKVNESDQSETVYSLHRWNKYEKPVNNKEIVVFQYHGTVQYPKTIVLGYDHYCGTLGKLDKYIKGDYAFNNGTTQKIPSMAKRLSDGFQMPTIESLGLKNTAHSDLYSWADTFFMTDLHIIGFGMDFSEADIWWLLDRRIRLKKQGRDAVVKNKIYYYVTDPITSINGELMQKLHLLRAYDVEVVTHNNLNELINGKPDYISIYLEQINNLRQNILKG